MLRRTSLVCVAPQDPAQPDAFPMDKLANDKIAVTLNDQTGAIEHLYDVPTEREILRFAQGPALEVNRRPVSPRVASVHDAWGDVTVRLDVPIVDNYMAGARYQLEQSVIAGGVANHLPGRNSAHLRHTIVRVPMAEHREPLDDLWQSPIEAPHRIDSMTVLCAPTAFFGPGTKMRAVAIGGSGPREHVSIEDDAIEKVLPWVQTKFRTQTPGHMGLPGFLYYHPEDERWLYVVVRHPHQGVRFHPSLDGLKVEMFAHQDMSMHGRIVFPDISFYWGRGMAEADRQFAEFFDLYEEPPGWWWNTTWFWAHTFWQPDATFDKLRGAVDVLMDDCGVTGFGLSAHDLPLAGSDVEQRSMRPSPRLGGEAAYRRLVKHIRDRGGKTYMFMARYGKLQAGGPDNWRDDWAIRGVDGRPVGRNAFRVVDAHHPGWRDYLKRWIARFIDMGVDGVFWDSAFQPMPPNFSEASKAYLNNPAEAMVGGPDCYEDLYRFGRSLHKDFFMWGEGLTTEFTTNGFAVDNRSHGEHSGHMAMARLAHAGPQRLVWRCDAFPRDLTGGFPFIHPRADIHASFDSDFYERAAADPHNRWTCQTVKDRGCRHAIGVGDGASVLDEFLVLGHGAPTDVTVPAALARSERLQSVIDGTKVSGEPTATGIRFRLPDTGAWSFA